MVSSRRPAESRRDPTIRKLGRRGGEFLRTTTRPTTEELPMALATFRPKSPKPGPVKLVPKWKLKRASNRILAKSGYFAKSEIVRGKTDPDAIGINGRLKISYYAGRAS